jgi:hypothetical protein
VILEKDGAISEATTRLVLSTSLEELGDSSAQPSVDVVSIDGKCGCCRALIELSPDLKFLSEADVAVPVDSPNAIEVAPHDGVRSISRLSRCHAQKDDSTQLWGRL